MARSFKKVPGYSDSEGSLAKAYFLRLMNRRIRRLDGLNEEGWIPNGNVYRRFVERYSYRDYNFRFHSRRELEKESWWLHGCLYKIQRK